MVLCSQKVAYYSPEYGDFSNIWCFAVRWLIISQRTRPLHSDGGLLFPRIRELFKRIWCFAIRDRDHFNQMVANYFPEHEAIAIRWWLIIS